MNFICPIQDGLYKSNSDGLLDLNFYGLFMVLQYFMQVWNIHFASNKS